MKSSRVPGYRSTSLIALLGFFAFGQAQADEYHNINGFFGERAAGLAGAYTAVADDPAGAYYNPAGIAFAYDNFISISASTYRESKKSYVNVFGPDQSYNRSSRGYVPNFFGAIKSFGDLRFGFSIVSPTTDDYDQADQIQFPLALNRVSNFRNDYTERNTQFLVGPSLAKPISSKFSIGATLYYLYDSARITTSQLTINKNGSYTSTDLTDRRRTMGFLPIVGMQYMPTDTLSLGASLRRPIVTAANRRKSGVVNNAARTAPELVLVESTSSSSAAATSGSAVAGPPESGAIPEAPELRVGLATFPSRYFMVSFDVIRSFGYKFEQDRTQADVNGDVFLNTGEVASLTRRPTTNFALGLEYFLSDNFALRGGVFTNKANSYEIKWADRALAALARNTSRNAFAFPTSSGTALYYNIPAFDNLERFEHVNQRGFSMGFTWGDSRSSLTVTYSMEMGKGTAQIDQTQAPQPLRVRSSSIYVVASTRT
ncbi:MAG: outer membrane protein transport protein [Leptospirales bacterium]|nr:outer membrane protein transport protein [Leptospirales bacterium]